MGSYKAKPGQRSHGALWRKRRLRLRYIVGVDFGAKSLERSVFAVLARGERLSARDLIARYGVATGRISYFYIEPV